MSSKVPIWRQTNQLAIAFGSGALEGLSAHQRKEAVRALARLLLEAAAGAEAHETEERGSGNDIA